MRPAQNTSDGSQWTSALLLVVFLLVAAFAYQPGTGGSVHFDDPNNLNGLARVDSGASATEFIMGGRAGPVGRPLALASFVPQAYAWPHSPQVFIYTNICIHLLNVTLAAWMLYLLAVASGSRSARAASLASWAAGLWALMPILASASLTIVQRMTTLSATFILIGIIGYLYGRSLLEQRPYLALGLMSLSITIGSALAVLAKENGALLPLFVLAAEVTILRPARCGRKLWNSQRLMFLAAPAAAIAIYLALQFQYDEAVLARRAFSAPERLLTQAHILWEYLYHAFIPSTASLGPFHDDYPVYREWLQPIALLAVAGWATVIVAAIALRRRAPLFSFAVAWYLVGHALESTTVPLELYFEHRNYMPLIGPAFALVAGILSFAPKRKAVAYSALAAYALVLAIVLHSTTSLWGRPGLAAEMWAIYSPNSKRAGQYLAQQLQTVGDFAAARRVIRGLQKQHPTSAALDLQQLGMTCSLERQNPQTERLAHLGESLPVARFEHGVFESLQRLYRMAKEGVCDAVDQSTIYTLASLTADNPAFHAHPIVHHNLHLLMAEEAFAQRNLDLTMRHLEQALSAYYAYTTLIFAIQMLDSAGLTTIAYEFVEEARSHRPSNPLRGLFWSKQISSLENALQQVHPL